MSFMVGFFCQTVLAEHVINLYTDVERDNRHSVCACFLKQDMLSVYGNAVFEFHFVFHELTFNDVFSIRSILGQGFPQPFHRVVQPSVVL